MPETPQQVVDRVFREHKRFTGDGLPNEPVGAPLPVGDPQSGVWNPRKRDLRNALLAPLADLDEYVQEVSVYAERAEEARDQAVLAADSVIDRAFIPDLAFLLADDNDEIGYIGSGARFELIPGKIIRTQKEGFPYSVAASDAVDAHIESAGGLKLYALPWGVGAFWSLIQFGFRFDGLTDSAAENSATLQRAIDYLASQNGGTLVADTGIAYLDAVPIVEPSVSLIGIPYKTWFVKHGDAASPESTSLVPKWDNVETPVPIGNPIAVIQFGHIGGANWSGLCYGICAAGAGTTFDGSLNASGNPNTTTTEFGFFIAGMSGAEMTQNYAEGVQNGFFWAANATITSEVRMNRARNVWRGFYEHFLTSCNFTNNFVARARYLGFYRSQYYSLTAGNACDLGGVDWRESDDEFFLAYDFQGCVGGEAVDNGAESNNGAVWRCKGNTQFRLANNIALDISSSYDGDGDIVALEIDGNIDCIYENNRAVLSAPTGDPARHFNTKVGTEYGNYKWERNSFVSVPNGTGDTAGWVQHASALRRDQGSFTATLTGVSGSITGTIRWSYSNGIVTLYIPAIQGTSVSSAATLTGLPVALRPALTQRMSIGVMDASSNVVGMIDISPSGVMELFTSVTPGSFTSSGVKGTLIWTLSYRLLG